MVMRLYICGHVCVCVRVHAHSVRVCVQVHLAVTSTTQSCRTQEVSVLDKRHATTMTIACEWGREAESVRFRVPSSYLEVTD